MAKNSKAIARLSPSDAAAALGRLGGATKTEAKAAAARRNGALGGPDRKWSRCPRYKNHRFSPFSDRCPCGATKKTARLKKSRRRVSK